MVRKSVDIIGAQYGLGSGKHGAWKGPSAIRGAGLVDRFRAQDIAVRDIGDAGAPLSKLPDSCGQLNLKYLDQYLSFHEDLLAKLRGIYDGGGFPLLLGGDHAVAFTSLSAAAEKVKRQHGNSGELGILWVDTHSDINTPDTTPSGNLHGMMIAAMLGYGDKRLTELVFPGPKLLPENIAYIGLRDVDQGEEEILKRLDIKTFRMPEIFSRGIVACIKDAIAHISRSSNEVLVSFDLDVCDPSIAPGVGTPCHGGITLNDARTVMSHVSKIPNLISLEVVELNPELDRNGMTCTLALDLIEHAFK